MPPPPPYVVADGGWGWGCGAADEAVPAGGSQEVVFAAWSIKTMRFGFPSRTRSWQSWPGGRSGRSRSTSACVGGGGAAAAIVVVVVAEVIDDACGLPTAAVGLVFVLILCRGCKKGCAADAPVGAIGAGVGRTSSGLRCAPPTPPPIVMVGIPPPPPPPPPLIAVVVGAVLLPMKLCSRPPVVGVTPTTALLLGLVLLMAWLL